jgi:hypothetical protein
MNKYETLVSNIASFSVGMIIGAAVLNHNDICQSPARANIKAKPPIEEKKKERKKIGFRLGKDER